MSVDNLKRFNRIVAILIQLQSKKIVKAQELADRFQVSLRTIYRDVRALEEAGIPIASEAGIGYSIVSGYSLPPVMFTREEAGSFVAAEKLMQKFADKALGESYSAAMYKIKSVLSSTGKERISALESHVLIRRSQPLFREHINNALEILFESIEDQTQIRILYQALDAETPTERHIEPVGIFHENNYWYIMGYCHLRKDYRQFRSDRILEIQKTMLPFTEKHGAIDQYINREKQNPKHLIKILVDKKIAPYLSGDKKYYGFVSEKTIKDQVEMTFLTCDIENSFARWFLMFGDYARIIEPEILKTRVSQLMESIQSALKP